MKAIMYLDYWQLDCKPFDEICETQSDSLSEAQRAAVRKLRYVVESRRSASLVAGPAGVGKTMVVETLQQELGDSCGPFVHIVFPQMPQRDLLAYLAERLGAPQVSAPQRTVDESLRRIETLFAGVAEDSPHSVVVVDEAHLLEDGVLLEPLRLLLNLRAKSHPAFTLVLCGQLELPAIVGRYGALEERVDVKVLLPAFSAEETAAYIA
ncbi:MAG: ATP-binding protein, partial [Planctomycetota bacterium]